MALSQSVASELLEAFRAGEGVDLIRESVQMVLQDLSEVEATERIGAGRYERSGTRTTEWTGSSTRLPCAEPRLLPGTHQPRLGAQSTGLLVAIGQSGSDAFMVVVH